MTLTRPPFPEIIDSTIISDYKSCAKKCYWRHMRYLSPSAKNIHLHAGGVFARGLEVSRNLLFDPTTAYAIPEALDVAYREMMKEWGDFECDPDDQKNLPRLMLALESYYQHYGVKSDRVQPFIWEKDGQQRPATEFTFSIPLNINHPETGDPLLFAGRFDMLAEYNGSLFVEDDKTAKQLGASWRKQWDLRGQFTGYCWASRQYGFPVAGAIIRGIGLLKTKITHEEAITFRHPHVIDRWLDSLYSTLHKMIEDWKDGDFDYNYADTCSAYGGCPYTILCETLDPEAWIENNFVEVKWNPLEDQRK